MRFSDVALTDLVPYRNARMADLPDGLGVVAGPQRAGKTTFTRAVRQLPFGIDRGDDLPPAANERQLAATVVRDGDRYALRVSGEAAPQLDPLDGAPSLDPADLVGGLTKAQYRQLFTISLAELQRRPDGIESAEQLSEVLLGAAYGDVSEVPALRDEYGGVAYDVGAKYGRSVSKIGDAVDEIEAAVADRGAATETVDEFETKRGELDDVESRLGELDRAEAELTAEKTRLTVLRGRFDDLDRYRTLRAERADLPDDPGTFPDGADERARELAADLGTASEELDAARADLASIVDADDPSAHAETLRDAAATVESYDRRVEKWRGTLTARAEDADELERQRADLRRRVGELRADWDELGPVRETPADGLTLEEVRSTTEQVESLRSELADERSALTATREELAALEERLAGADAELEAAGSAAGGARSVAVGTAVALVGLLLGAGVGTVAGAVVGYGVAALGVLAGFAYTLWTVGGGTDADAVPVRELRAKVDDREAEIAGHETSIASLEADLSDAEAELEALRHRFDLPPDVSPGAVREFFDDFATLRADLLAHDDRLEAHTEERAAFDERLREVATDLDPLVDFEWDDQAPREHAESLFLGVETATEAVVAAEEFRDARDQLAERRANAVSLLSGWTDGTERDRLESADVPDLVDRLCEYADAAETAARVDELETELADYRGRLESDFERTATVEAFEPLRAGVEDGAAADGAELSDGGVETGGDGAEANDDATTAWAIPALERLADGFATVEDIDARLDAVEDELSALDAEREGLRTERAELRERLDRLASDEDLRDAEEHIQRGRERLRSLGEDYATYRVAEHLLDRVHDRFLEEATGPLLEEAGDIFARITDEYDGVAHDGDLDSLEFLASRDGSTDLDVGALSRATAEQLFLSVRLARIRQFDEPLPVVIDDALTNFDPAHARRTVAFLDELARTNQVLLLTCHPELIRVADDVADVAGYWQLDDGRFEGPSTDPAAALSLLDAGDGPSSS